MKICLVLKCYLGIPVWFAYRCCEQMRLENMYIMHTFDRWKSLKDWGHITQNQYFFSLVVSQKGGTSSASYQNGVAMGQCCKVEDIVFPPFWEDLTMVLRTYVMMMTTKIMMLLLMMMMMLLLLMMMLMLMLLLMMLVLMLMLLLMMLVLMMMMMMLLLLMLVSFMQYIYIWYHDALLQWRNNDLLLTLEAAQQVQNRIFDCENSPEELSFVLCFLCACVQRYIYEQPPLFA